MSKIGRTLFQMGVIVGLISSLTACVSEILDKQVQEFLLNRSLWQSHGITSYQVDYHRDCSCNARPPVTVTVVNNQVTVPADAPYIPTIDELFDRIETISRSALGSVEVEYDTQYGFPIRITADPHHWSSTNQYTITLQNFVPQL